MDAGPNQPVIRSIQTQFVSWMREFKPVERKKSQCVQYPLKLCANKIDFGLCIDYNSNETCSHNGIVDEFIHHSQYNSVFMHSCKNRYKWFQWLCSPIKLTFFVLYNCLIRNSIFKVKIFDYLKFSRKWMSNTKRHQWLMFTITTMPATIQSPPNIIVRHSATVSETITVWN